MKISALSSSEYFSGSKPLRTTKPMPSWQVAEMPSSRALSSAGSGKVSGEMAGGSRPRPGLVASCRVDQRSSAKNARPASDRETSPVLFLLRTTEVSQAVFNPRNVLLGKDCEPLALPSRHLGALPHQRGSERGREPDPAEVVGRRRGGLPCRQAGQELVRLASRHVVQRLRRGSRGCYSSGCHDVRGEVCWLSAEARRLATD